MKGIVLNDEENLIAQHMEHDLQGKYIPVKFDDKKGFTGNIITLEQLGRLAKEIDRLVMQMGLDLHKGKISQNPVNGKKHDKTCEFCDYKYVCMNQREIVPRELQELTDSQVLNMIKEDDTDAKVD
jgi:ATP-dependent helicase/nuclease subunit B